MDVTAPSATPVAPLGLPIKDESTVAMRRRQRPQAQRAVHGPGFFPPGPDMTPPASRVGVMCADRARDARKPRVTLRCFQLSAPRGFSFGLTFAPSPAPCGTGSGGFETRPKTGPAPQLRYCPRRPFPKVWSPVTRLHSVDGLLSPKSSAPLGSVSFRGLASTYRRSDRRSTAFLRKIGTSPKPLPCNETSPTTLRIRRPCGTTWDNPVNNGRAYPQTARQCGSGVWRSPVDSAAAVRHEPSASGGQGGVLRMGIFFRPVHDTAVRSAEGP